jgi:hypothetical protein
MKILTFLLLLFISTQVFSQKKTKTRTADCSWAYSVVDDFTGKEKNALKACKIFGYTPEAQKKFFPVEDYLECEGHLIESDGNILLHLKFTYQDKDADQQVGTISPGSTISIKPMKGNAVSLVTFKGAIIDKKNSSTIYECSYSVTKNARKILENIEIDNILVNWSKGFMVYEVYYMDFISDQLSCLSQ